jgi:hypothetical protein
MSSHHRRLTSNHATFDLPKHPTPGIATASSEEATVAELVSTNVDVASASAAAHLDAAPLAPSQRLPLIAHALREAQVGIAELRYEGRGGMGGFITEFHDRHRLKSLGHLIEERIAQQLTGYMWQLVLRRQPNWNDHTGSFGVVTWNLKTDLIRHIHNQRIMEVKITLIEGL